MGIKSNLKETMEVYILHITILGKTPSKCATLFHVKPSDFRFVTWFESFLKFDLPRLQFEVFQTKSELF